MRPHGAQEGEVSLPRRPAPVAVELILHRAELMRGIDLIQHLPDLFRQGLRRYARCKSAVGDEHARHQFIREVAVPLEADGRLGHGCAPFDVHVQKLGVNALHPIIAQDRLLGIGQPEVRFPIVETDGRRLSGTLAGCEKEK